MVRWVRWHPPLPPAPPPAGPAAPARTDLEQPGQAKVSHFASQVVAHEHIPGGQVSMHDAPLLQVAHALSHLAGKAQQDWRVQGTAFGACRGSRQSGHCPLCLSFLI